MKFACQWFSKAFAKLLRHNEVILARANIGSILSVYILVASDIGLVDAF